jgi:sarcosine oxidase delta subunit
MARFTVQLKSSDDRRFIRWVGLREAREGIATGQWERMEGHRWYLREINPEARSTEHDPLVHQSAAGLTPHDAEALAGLLGPAIARRVARERVAPRAPGWVAS